MSTPSFMAGGEHCSFSLVVRRTHYVRHNISCRGMNYASSYEHPFNKQHWLRKKAKAPVCSVTVNTMQIEQVNHFKYLGSWITSDGRSDMDIKCRLGQAKQTLMDMRNVICARNLGFHLRTRLLKCYIWSVLLYGCESWTLSKNMEKSLRQQKCGSGER